MTAVRTRSDVSMAARSPAPPAPTITASYVWVVAMSAHVSRPLRWIEGEHDHRAQNEEREAEHVEDHVDREPQAGLAHVIERDHAQSVDAVDEREYQEHPVPRP